MKGGSKGECEGERQWAPPRNMRQRKNRDSHEPRQINLLTLILKTNNDDLWANLNINADIQNVRQNMDNLSDIPPDPVAHYGFYRSTEENHGGRKSDNDSDQLTL